MPTVEPHDKQCRERALLRLLRLLSGKATKMTDALQNAACNEADEFRYEKKDTEALTQIHLQAAYDHARLLESALAVASEQPAQGMVSVPENLLNGCQSSICQVRKPTGMRHNGGCKCMQRITEWLAARPK